MQLRAELSLLRSKRADQTARVGELEGEVERLAGRCRDLEAGIERAALERELAEVKGLLKTREEEVAALRMGAHPSVSSSTVVEDNG